MVAAFFSFFGFSRTGLEDLLTSEESAFFDDSFSFGMRAVAVTC